MSKKATTLLLFAAILALSFGIVRPLHAQVAGATLSGTITDAHKAALFPTRR